MMYNSNIHRQGYCPSCEHRLVWKFTQFGCLADMKCPFCNGELNRTTFYMLKKPTIVLLKPIKTEQECVFKCPHENCNFQCGYVGVLQHQREHKEINKQSPYFDPENRGNK